MKKNNYLTAFCVLTAPLAVSCVGNDSAPGEFHSIPGAEWRYGQTIGFNEARDTIGGEIKAVELSVRHDNDYPYANLWVELAYNVKDSLVADTFNVIMANEYGKWYGTGSGPVRMLSDTLKLRNRPDADSEFRLRHIMRVEALPDVEQVGLRYITDKDLSDAE